MTTTSRVHGLLAAPILLGFLAGSLAISEEKKPSPAPTPAPPAASSPSPAPWHDDPNVQPSQDAKALEVLKAGIKALGGESALLGRKTIYIKRKCINHETPEPREGTITIWYKRPDKFRKEVAYPNEKHTIVLDGSNAFADDGKGIRRLGPTGTASTMDGLQELDLPANYLSADLTYFNISQEIPGKLAHVVKVRQHGYTRELMFDVNTNLLQISGEYENPWGATDKMQRFDRYRPVDGIMVPFRVEHWRSNEVVLETEILEIKFNGPMDDSLFTLQTPPSAGSSK